MQNNNTLSGFHIRSKKSEVLKLHSKKYTWHIPKHLRDVNLQPGDIVAVGETKAPVLVTEVFREEKYDRLLNLKQKYTSDTLSLKEKENLIKALQQNEIDVPLKVVLEEVFEQIKEDFLYIGEAIENSPKQEKEVAEYVWEYLYGDTLFELDKNKLIEFANKIFIFTQKLKMKLLKLDNVFDDDDWFSLKDILDEYEIY